MVPLKQLVVALAFYELIVNSDAQARCPKGQRVVVRGSRTSCGPCSGRTYQPEENESQSCKACTKCDKLSGSDILQECTRVTNTKCHCRGKFVPLDKSDNSTCKCDIGYELKSQECSECEAGYFSTSIDSTCRKWRECKSGVQKNGTRISDVICKDETKSDTSVGATPTPHNIASTVRHFTSNRPHEGAQTQKIHTTTTTSAPRHTTPVSLPTSGSQIGLFLIIGMGLVLLLVLTARACKQHVVIPRGRERQQPEQKSESLCRKPVEESGDSSEALFKQNP